jgi:hypothetical protein
MLYHGVEYSVVQGIERHLWQWAATVSGTKISGARQRAARGQENAKEAIARAIEKQRFKQDTDRRRSR